jgi:hypothetical protein
VVAFVVLGPKGLEMEAIAFEVRRDDERIRDEALGHRGTVHLPSSRASAWGVIASSRVDPAREVIAPGDVFVGRPEQRVMDGRATIVQAISRTGYRD